MPKKTSKTKVQFTGKVSDFLKIGGVAAARGDVDLMREILAARPKWIHRIGSHGRTLLWEASHKGKLPMVKYLVRRKADIDACGSHYTPYFVEISCYCIARHKKHDDVADFLLQRGAKVDSHTAAFLGDLPLLKKLIGRSKKKLDEGHPQYEMAENDAPVDFYMADSPWATPLCYALRGGDVETVEFLIKRGARIKGFERTHFISANDQPAMVRLLLENGADPEHAPQAHPDDKELYDVVSRFGVKRPSSQSMSVELVYLCRGDRGGNPDEVQQLLAHGADVDFADHKGKTALHRAAKSGFLDTMKVLIDADATIDIPDPAGETALFEPVRSTIKKKEHRIAAIKLLLKHGADKKHKNKKGLTALSVAKTKKLHDPEIIRALQSR